MEESCHTVFKILSARSASKETLKLVKTWCGKLKRHLERTGSDFERSEGLRVAHQFVQTVADGRGSQVADLDKAVDTVLVAAQLNPVLEHGNQGRGLCRDRDAWEDLAAELADDEVTLKRLDQQCKDESNTGSGTTEQQKRGLEEQS